MKILFFIITLTIIAGCKPKKNATASENSNNTEVAKEPEYEFKNISPNDSLFASIVRSPCFGQCPIYSLQIYNGGLVKYKGKNFVKRTGEYVMELDKSKMLTFVNKARAISYMQLNDTYDNKSVTDLPSTTTSIVIDGIRKKVYKRFGAPKELNEFERLFDDLLNSEKWIKVESEKDEKH